MSTRLTFAPCAAVRCGAAACDRKNGARVLAANSASHCVGVVVPPPPVDVPRGSDKLVHLLSYGALAASAVQLFAQRSALLRAGIGLVALGVALEFAQDALTSTRMLDPNDMLANAFGVLFGLATARTPLRDVLLRLERRLHL